MVLRAHPGVRLASIGPGTSRNLARFGFTADVEPADYTIPALAGGAAKAL
jgi:uroporphyrinogen III methyltransferase/synthase